MNEFFKEAKKDNKLKAFIAVLNRRISHWLEPGNRHRKTCGNSYSYVRTCIETVITMTILRNNVSLFLLF